MRRLAWTREDYRAALMGLAVLLAVVATRWLIVWLLG